MILLPAFAIAVVILSGICLTHVLRATSPSRSEAAPLGMAAGVALLGVLATAGVVANMGNAWILLSLGVLGIGYAGGLVLLFRGGDHCPHRVERAEVALLFAAVAVGALLLYAARFEQLFSDGWSVWQIKAEALRIDAFAAQGEMHQVLNGWDYPLAWPALHAFVATVVKQSTWVTASFVAIAAFLFIGWLLWASLRSAVPTWAAALTGLAGVCAWGMGSYALAGFADAFVGFAVLGMIIEIERIARGDARAIRRLAIYIALAALLKNEGLFFGFLAANVATLYLLATQRRDLWRAWPVLVALVPALIWRLHLPMLLGAREASQVAELVRANVNAGGVSVFDKIVLYLGGLQGLLTSKVWAGLLLLIPAGVLGIVDRPRRSVLVAWGAILLFMGSFAFAYLSMGMNPMKLAISSMPRLVGDFAPALIYLSVLSVWGNSAEAAAGEEHVDG